jgi:hypothetical protein
MTAHSASLFRSGGRQPAILSKATLSILAAAFFFTCHPEAEARLRDSVPRDLLLLFVRHAFSRGEKEQRDAGGQPLRVLLEESI